MYGIRMREYEFKHTLYMQAKELKSSQENIYIKVPEWNGLSFSMGAHTKKQDILFCDRNIYI